MAVSASLLLAAGGVSPAFAATSAVDSSSNLISGFIVNYEEGVVPIAKNGALTGTNLISQKIESFKSLGVGLYSLKLVNPISQNVAEKLAARLELDPRFEWVDLDRSLAVAFASPAKPFQAARPASAPRSLVAARSSSKDAPTQPRIKLTWKQPSSIYGAQVVGYRVQFRLKNTSKWKISIGNSGNSETVAYVSSGIEAGYVYNFRVLAITSNGGLDVLGSPSAIATLSPRTTPRPVALIGGQTLIGPGVVYWVEQNKTDRGGYSSEVVTYAGTARAEGLAEIGTVDCNQVRCRFNNLDPQVTYTLEIFATNPKGITGNLDEVLVTDEYYPDEWHLRGTYGVSMSQAWHFSKGSSSVVVAVIDSGITVHPELESRFVKDSYGVVTGYDFVSNQDSSADGDGWDADATDMGGDAAGGVSSWHGTHVAGILAAEINQSGVVGVAPKTKILPIRALGRAGGEESDLIAAINWAAGVKVEGVPVNKYPARVINMSLGSQDSSACSASTQEAINNALELGVTVVTAAGNKSTSASSSYPGNCVGVINVAATSSNGDRALYSNFGPEISISAPGGDNSSLSPEASRSRGMIVSTWIDGSGQPGYGIAEGTSMAAPIVSGVVALMYAINPAITPRQVLAIIQNSTKRFLPGGNCDVGGGCGPGILDAHLALARTSIAR